MEINSDGCFPGRNHCKITSDRHTAISEESDSLVFGLREDHPRGNLPISETLRPPPSPPKKKQQHITWICIKGDFSLFTIIVNDHETTFLPSIWRNKSQIKQPRDQQPPMRSQCLMTFWILSCRRSWFLNSSGKGSEKKPKTVTFHEILLG